MDDFLLSFRGVVKKDNGFVFFENNMQALCCWEYASNEIKVISGCDGYEYFIGFNIFEHNDEIIVVSNYGQRILIWNSSNNLFEEIIGDNISNKNEVISQCLFLNNKIYLIYQKPSLNPIIIFDVNTHGFYSSDILQKELQNIDIWSPFVFSTDLGFVGMDYGNNTIFEVDFEKNVAKMELDSAAKKLLCAGKYKDEILTCSFGSYVIHSDKRGDYSIIQDGEICKEPYSYMEILDDYFVILPRFSNKVIIFTEESKFFIELGSYADVKNKGASVATGCFQINHDIFLCPTNKKGVVKICVDKCNYEMVFPTMTKSCYHRMLQVKGIEYDGIIYEERFADSCKAINYLLEMIE